MTDSRDSESGRGPYQMTLSLNVLEHLGLNLYSNVPAVLSETVANSWDADAEEVAVKLDPDEERIVIEDNGHGMNRDDVNNRYLHVGYQRRKDEDRPKTTPKHNRDVMGRKGIGKLSLFSIANTVDVHTVKDGERSAFRMEVEAIKEAIQEEDEPTEDDSDSATGTYEPTPIKNEIPSNVQQGTAIVLTDLKKSIHQAADALRKRLARRFSILSDEYQFRVEVNGEPVKVTDRDYFHKVQYLWTFDDHDKYADYCTNLENHVRRDGETDSGYEISGWIGTVQKPNDLVENHPGPDETDDLNKVTLMVRGKMAQDDLLENFNDGRFYTKYLVGEIHAEFLDVDGKDDIATSSRENMDKDDPRFKELETFLERQLDHIAEKWDDLRRDEGADKAKEIPAIRDWYDSLESEDKRKQAKKLFGKINEVKVDSDDDHKELFKYGILAFENLRYKESLSRLDNLSPDDLAALSEAFIDLDDIEATLYHQIVSQRLRIISEMQEKVEENALEDAIQEHLYDHPWLLDPSWERATEDHMESQIRKQFDDVDADLTEEEKRGRVDIKYIKTSGQHVIVELKRPEVLTDTYELLKQIRKYRSALKKHLKKSGQENFDIEVVIILGKEPRDWHDEEDGRKESRETLAAKDARILFYEELLTDAKNAYQEYIDRHKEANQVAQVIEQIDAEGVFEPADQAPRAATD